MALKKNSPGCNCCGPCCNQKSAAATVSGATISASSSDLIYPLTAAFNWDTSRCLIDAYAAECVTGGWTDIRFGGPASTCGILDPLTAGWWRTILNSFANTFGATCVAGGTYYPPGTAYDQGAIVSVAMEVSCDGNGNAIWVFIASLYFGMRFGTQGCSPATWDRPSAGTLTGLGYTDVSGTNTDFRKVTTSTGYRSEEFYSRNPTFASINYWTIGQYMRWTKSVDSDLIGLSGTLSPTYNPHGMTASWSIS